MNTRHFPLMNHTCVLNTVVQSTAMATILDVVQLTNNAASLIKQQKYKEASSFLHEVLSFIGSSLDNPISYDIDANHVARGPIKILYKYTSREDQVEYKGECDEGMRTFSEPLGMIIPVVGENDCRPSDQTIVDAVVNYNLGIISTRLDQDDKAYPYFQKSLSLVETYSPLAQNECKMGHFLIAILHNLGHIEYRNRQYEEALSKYQIAQKKISEECYDCSSFLIDKAICLNCIGMAIMQISQGSDDGTEESLHHLNEALITIHVPRFGKKAYQFPDNFIREKITAIIMNNIGRIRVLRAETDEALSLYKKAFKIRRRILGEDNLDTVVVNFNMAEALLLGGQTTRALKKLQKFICMSSSLLLDHHLAAVFILFAEAYTESNNLMKAVQFYQKALRKLKVAHPIDQEQIAQISNSLGNLLCRIGEHDSALKVYTEGLDIELQLYEPNDAKIIVTVLNIARVYHHKNSFHNALEKYNEGLRMQRRGKEVNRLDIASTLEGIGLINIELGRLDRSIDAYLEALIIKREELGNNHLDVSTLMNSIGLVYFRKAQYDDALDYFKESLSICSNVCESNLRSCASVQFNIAMTHMEKCHYTKALKSFQKCVDIESSELDEGETHNTTILSTLEGIRLVYERMNCPMNASYIHQETKELRRANMCAFNALQVHKEKKTSPLANLCTNVSHFDRDAMKSRRSSW